MKKIGCILLSLIIASICIVPCTALENDNQVLDDTNNPQNIEVKPNDSQNMEQDKESLTDINEDNLKEKDSGDIAICDVGEITPTDEEIPHISYQTHVQDIGWQEYVQDGLIAGTEGKSKRLEAIRMKLINLAGDIEYSTHIQNIGWQDWKNNDNISGTFGRSLRLEAIKIRLTGEAANEYDIYYQVHAQNFGWLGWAKNGENAGTAGYSYRLEAIRVKLVKKGEGAPGKTDNQFYQRFVSYSTHVQDIGWQEQKYDGEVSGTQGRGKRLEAISIKLVNPEYSGKIQYRTHVQNVGWESSWKSNGTISGTTGRHWRLEGIQIKLTDEMANYYDVYYRVHIERFGWLDWAKNGESAGSEGCELRLEAIQIEFVPKGQSFTGNQTKPFIRQGNVNYTVYSPSTNWQNTGSNGLTKGNPGSGQRLEALKMTLGTNDYSGSIQYAAHIQNVGWTNYYSDGQVCGNVNSNNQIEGIRVRLTGEISTIYDVYYRVYVQNIGWLSWTSNGRDAGTSGGSFKVEAIQVKMIIKGANLDNPANAFYTFKSNGGYLVAYDAYGNAHIDSQYLFGANRAKQIKVSLANKTVDVLIQNGTGNYNVTLKRFTVTVGKPSTPTVRGDFYIYQHRSYFDSGNARCFYFSPFKGGYGFHSVLYYQDSTPQRILDGRLGMELSHGCVRMNVNEAKWIYDNCPIGTKVSIR